MFFFDREPTKLTKQIEDLTKYQTRKNNLKFEIERLENLSFKENELEQKYHDFQLLAQKKFGNKITLKPNILSTFFDHFLDHPSILPKVKKLIGENIYVWSSAIFAKAPGEGRIVSYHQDNPYWQLSNEKVVTVWIALTDSNKESGALELLPKSQNIGVINKLDVSNAAQIIRVGLEHGVISSKLEDSSSS